MFSQLCLDEYQGHRLSLNETKDFKKNAMTTLMHKNLKNLTNPTYTRQWNTIHIKQRD